MSVGLNRLQREETLRAGQPCLRVLVECEEGLGGQGVESEWTGQPPLLVKSPKEM